MTVTWPDGRTETFDFTPKGLNTFFGIPAIPSYTGRPGTTSRLEAAPGDSGAGWRGDGNLYSGGFGEGPIYDPQQFVLVRGTAPGTCSTGPAASSRRPTGTAIP